MLIVAVSNLGATGLLMCVVKFIKGGKYDTVHQQNRHMVINHELFSICMPDCKKPVRLPGDFLL